MASSALHITSISSHLTFSPSSKSSIFPQNPNFLHFPSTPSPLSLKLTSNLSFSPIKSTPPSAAAESAVETTSPTFHGLCYVVGDNIDTDQIIPAEYLTLVPSNPEEYKKLGSYALIGLPESYPVRFVEENETQSKYSIIIAGANFGCGSSREHAPVALGAAGTAAVVAESYARIFFRNSVSTGEVYPIESEVRVCEEFKTGDVATIELGENKLINHTSGKEYVLKPIGDAGPVVEAGGIFAYARKAGMIAAAGVSD